MSEQPKAFKDHLGPARVKALGVALSEVYPEFPRSRFAKRTCAGLEDLELKARVTHVIAGLRESLPAEIPDALSVLSRFAQRQRALRDEERLPAFACWPAIDFVGEHGLPHFDQSLETLAEMTGLFSAEFAIRPFLEASWDRALCFLEQWCRHDDEHVRRLVSEGTRPRLPWGARLPALEADPSPALPLLEALRADESEYVRRSVANHLNDLSKAHPPRVVAICERWLSEAPKDRERGRLVRHALRTLVKQGDPAALKVLGYSRNAKVSLETLDVTPSVLRLGGSLEIRFDLRSTSRKVQPLVVDYAVHHRKANGSLSPKVFKLKTLRLPGEGVVSLRKAHPMRPITTRVYYPGTHRVEILVNGRSLGSAEFELKL